MMMEDRLVRDLPEKSSVNLDDKMVVEDIDGTKLVQVNALRETIMAKLIFENVEAMRSASIDCDTLCITLGYREAGDGGGAYYKIVYEPTVVDDGANWLYLYTSDVNRAKFISIDGTVNPEQFGAYGNGINDDSAAITKCLKSRYETRFTSGKKYSLGSSIEVPDKDYICIDLNGCTLQAEVAVQGLIKAAPILTSSKENRELVIKNGYLDMTNHGGEPINIDRYFKRLTLRNISVVNARSSCVIRGGMNTSIINCDFCYVDKKDPNLGSATAIVFGCGSSTLKYQTLNVTEVLFDICSGIQLSDSSLKPHPNTVVNIDNCKISAPQGFMIWYTLVNDNFNTTLKPFSVNLSNIDAFGIENLVNERGTIKCNISFRDITINSCRNLFSSNNPNAIFSIYGSILDISDYSTNNIYPLIPAGSGEIHLNTTNIKLSGSHKSAQTTIHNSPLVGTAPGGDTYGLQFEGLYGYSYTLYDNTNIDTYEKTSPSYTGGIVPILKIENHVIELTTSTDRVTDISPGLNNQIIGLTCQDTDEYTIHGSTTISLKSNKPDPNVNILSIVGRMVNTDCPNIVYFKYNSQEDVWYQL